MGIDKPEVKVSRYCKNDARYIIWAIPAKYGSASGKYYTANIVPTNSGYKEYILKSEHDKQIEFAKQDARQAWRDKVKELEDKIAELKEGGK